MHELSIAVDLVELACDHLARLGDVRIEALHLRIGPLCGVVKDALIFSFDVAAADTRVAGARLEIEDTPLIVWCPRCASERTLAGSGPRRCPSCGAPTPKVVHGSELELVALEVIDGAADR